MLEEIDATQDLPRNANREAHGNAVIEAGEAIAERLEQEGHPELAQRAREIAQQRATQINNEV